MSKKNLKFIVIGFLSIFPYIAIADQLVNNDQINNYFKIRNFSENINNNFLSTEYKYTNNLNEFKNEYINLIETNNINSNYLEENLVNDKSLISNTIYAKTHGKRIVRDIEKITNNEDYTTDSNQLNDIKNVSTFNNEEEVKNNVKVEDLNKRAYNINKKIERRLSASSALTSLFQPYGLGKLNLTAGIGGYGSSTSVAVGSGYRLNEHIAFKTGAAYFGGGNVLYNASFNLEW